MTERDEFAKKHYPRWIYPPEGSDEKPFIVSNAYDHASWCEKGWSGPPIFFDEITSLEDDIKQTEKELEQKKKLLATLKSSAGEIKEDGENEESNPLPTPPPPANSKGSQTTSTTKNNLFAKK